VSLTIRTVGHYLLMLRIKLS